MEMLVINSNAQNDILHLPNIEPEPNEQAVLQMAKPII